jgi:hypothetical protein
VASVSKHPNGWRAQVYVQGIRESKLCRTRNDAQQWARAKETELKERGDILVAPFQAQYEPLARDRLWQQAEVTSLTRNCGVYFLWSPLAELVYIGQSRDVAKRVAMHKKNPPANFDRATYIRVPYPWQLAVERLYIDKFIGGTLDQGSGICLANCN